MSDETTGTSQADGQGAPPPAGDGQSGTDGNQQQSPPTTPTLTLEQAIAELERTRKEAANYRTKARDAEAKVKSHEDAQLSELERAKREAQEAAQREREAREELKAIRTRTEIERAAAKLGIVDADAAARLLDQGTLDFDERGALKNAEAVLRDLVKEKPYLLQPTRRPGADAGSGRNQDAPVDMNTLIRRAGGRA